MYGGGALAKGQLNPGNSVIAAEDFDKLNFHQLPISLATKGGHPSTTTTSVALSDLILK